MRRSTLTCALASAVLLLCRGDSWAAGSEGAGEPLGAVLPIWWALPFVGVLLSIALFPLFAPRFWHNHYPKVAAFWGIVVAAPLVIFHGDAAVHKLLEVGISEYLPFIILLWALFTIAGGIHLKGTLSGTPATNTALLAIGTAIASWVGTTGAAMILIRTLLRANAWRRRKAHVVCFFIFLVCNVGGALTPLGDPPLFLGFLNGVPFFWTMTLLPEMLFVSMPLLGLFFILDRRYYAREEPRKTREKLSLRVEGVHNLLFLAGVVGAVLMSGIWKPGSVTVLGVEEQIQNLSRDALLILMGAASLLTTQMRIRTENEFTWGPIKEVAILFAGIFATIVPPLAILKAGEHGQLGALIRPLQTPSHYYWITGSLSSFLDNAPSYLTFLNSALGKFFSDLPAREGVHRLIIEQSNYLRGISLGAVFFGATTYIGNAPNFMVKSIAEEAGVKMPTFFGFMLKYSLPLLLPLFALVTIIFL
jgi:Na+/H+ antiporter NhaD/arsenite permease-like protein